MNDHLEFACGIADNAGKIMRQYFKVGVERDIKADEGDTPVTIADKQINEFLIDAVSKKYPDHSIIGEEASRIVEGAKWKWICDPVDGTMPFTMGVPTNVFSLSLLDIDGQPVVSVVLDPYMRRLYTAIKGQGACLNGEPMHVNATADLKDAFIGNSAGRSVYVDPIKFRAAILGASFRPFILNCSIYEAMLVASGQLAATCYLGSGAYDAASSKLIVEEAGGKVTNVFGEEQRYDEPIKGAIISNSLVHDALVTMAKTYRI